MRFSGEIWAGLPTNFGSRRAQQSRLASARLAEHELRARRVWTASLGVISLGANCKPGLAVPDVRVKATSATPRPVQIAGGCASEGLPRVRQFAKNLSQVIFHAA